MSVGSATPVAQEEPQLRGVLSIATQLRGIIRAEVALNDPHLMTGEKLITTLEQLEALQDSELLQLYYRKVRTGRIEDVFGWVSLKIHNKIDPRVSFDPDVNAANDATSAHAGTGMDVDGGAGDPTAAGSGGADAGAAADGASVAGTDQAGPAPAEQETAFEHDFATANSVPRMIKGELALDYLQRNRQGLLDLSHRLQTILRHNLARASDPDLHRDGWFSLDELVLEHTQLGQDFGSLYEDRAAMVEYTTNFANEPPRFELNANRTAIRATRGHTGNFVNPNRAYHALKACDITEDVYALL